MSERLQGKRLVVIGAGTGIGAATVRRLASEGAQVCVADINRDAAKGVADDVTAQGGKAFAVGIDITDEASIAVAIKAAVEGLGGLDGAHLNAADLRVIFQDSDALDVALDVFDRTIDVNLRGHLRCTKAILPHLLANGGGAIVYTSSGAADEGEPTRPSYAASKSGLNALMRHVASRWGKEGVTANAIAPGFVMTPELIAGGGVPEDFIAQCLKGVRSTRLGKADDIAGMAAMLLSEDGRWINGQVIHVNGGALMP